MRILSLVLVSMMAGVATADAVVRQVARNSAAERAGLQAGDVIVDADRVAVRFVWNLEYVVKRAKSAGAPSIAVRYRRGEEMRTAQLEPDLAGLSIEPDDPPDRLMRELLDARERDNHARADRAVCAALDHACGVGDQLLTDGLAMLQRGEGAGRLRVDLARFVAACAAREMSAIAEGRGSAACMRSTSG